VTDQGIGISMEDRPNLFKPYFKTKDAKSRSINKESHGLGLNICKKIAKNLGGDLNLNEHYNQGAQFILNLTANLVTPLKKERNPKLRTFYKTKFGKNQGTRAKKHFGSFEVL
jgi:two-component system sensor histidine kinase BarA